MRAVDADELRKHAFTIDQGNGVELEPIEVVPLAVIDNAPTVEPEKILVANVTFDEDKLHEIVQREVIDKINSGELVLKEERPQDKWIPISEKLPNRNGVYMVTRIIDGTRITDACYFDGQNTWHRDTGINHGRPYLTDIIAWQYKPDPYRKGGAEE